MTKNNLVQKEFESSVPREPLDSWYFDDITLNLRDSIEFAYTLRRKRKGKSIPYNGPELTALDLLVGAPGVKETLEAEWLRISDEDQGRDALQEILGCAVRIGIEQGFRMFAKDRRITELYVSVLRRYIENPVPEDKEIATMTMDQIEEALKEPGGIGYTLKESKLDDCEVCKGAMGGVPGNENYVEGVVMCDYCHASKKIEDKDS